MSYTLYYSPDSANLIVRMALEELSVPYKAVHVDRAASAHKRPDYLALNPQGLIPVLLTPDQDEPLFETGAILLYLADRHSALAPNGEAARGRFLKWMFFLSNTLHADLRVRFYSTRYVSTPSAVEALHSGLAKRVGEHLALLESEISRNLPPAGPAWLMGETLTACDLYLAALVRWSQIYPAANPIPADIFATLPRLSALLASLAERPAISRAFEQEGLVGHPFIAPVARI
jgi:glutathione S-transferase